MFILFVFSVRLKKGNCSYHGPRSAPAWCRRAEGPRYGGSFVEFVGAGVAEVLTGFQKCALGGVEVAEEVFDVAAGEGLRPVDASLDALGDLAHQSRCVGVVALP